jgi:hypothetical protein
MDTLGKVMLHVPGRMKWDGLRFHHTTHNGACDLKLMNCFFLEFSM